MSSASPPPPRDTHGPTPVAQFAPVADLAARAREIDNLSQRIVPSLPAPLRDHVAYAGVRNDRVLLLVHSPAWAARVRMDQAHILAAVRSLGLAAGSVVAKVVPFAASIEESTTPRNASANAGRSIRSAANAIADADLKALFLELAAAAERQTTP